MLNDENKIAIIYKMSQNFFSRYDRKEKLFCFLAKIVGQWPTNIAEGDIEYFWRCNNSILLKIQ